MPDPMITKLVEERAAKLALVESIKTSALDSERDLNSDDIETINRTRERVNAIDVQLETIGDNLELSDEVRTRLARIQPGSVAAPAAQYRSAGALLWDALHSNTDREAGQRYSRFMTLTTRAAEHMGTTAAATTPVAGGVPGLLIDPTVGPIIDVKPSGRPFLTALGVQAAPRAMTFHRPYLVDPDLLTGVAPQTLQKGELVSKKFDVNRSDLALKVIGGYLNVSQPLIEFTAQGLDIIIAQLNRRYALVTETMALTELALSTSKVTLSLTGDGAAVLKALYDASALVYAQTGSLATMAVMGPAGWARLGSIVDLAGRPLFPTLGAANAIGTQSATSFSGSLAGLNVVVTHAITDGDIWVLNADGLEFYEYRFPLLEAVEPSLLGRQIAVSGAVASYRPNPGNGAVLLAP